MSETAKDDAAAAVGDLSAAEAEPRAADDAAAAGAGATTVRLNEAFSRFDAALRNTFGEPASAMLSDDRPRAVIVRARTIWAVFAAGAALGACAAGLAAAAGFILAMGA